MKFLVGITKCGGRRESSLNKQSLSKRFNYILALASSSSSLV